MSTSHSHHETFCARCVQLVTEDSQACPSCQTSFAGSGRFMRISGPRPAVIPQRRPWAAATRLAAR